MIKVFFVEISQMFIVVINITQSRCQGVKRHSLAGRNRGVRSYFVTQ